MPLVDVARMAKDETPAEPSEREANLVSLRPRKYGGHPKDPTKKKRCSLVSSRSSQRRDTYIPRRGESSWFHRQKQLVTMGTTIRYNPYR